MSKIRLIATLFVGVLYSLPALALGECSADRPRQIFEALEQIDAAGEKSLQAGLEALSKKEGWTQSDWERFTLSLADNAVVNAREDRRSALFSDVFVLLGKTPVDCERLDTIEREMLELEQAQWDDSLRAVERRLNSDSARPGDL